MKRLLFIFCFLLMLPFAQAQNNDKYPASKTSQELDNQAFEKTIQAYRVTPANRIYTSLDTVRTGDTTSIMYFGNLYDDCFITLYDSLGKATSDTFYVERYDTLAPQASKAWTSVQVLFVDISTNNYTPTVTGRYGYSGANVITPGAGLTKTYYIMEPRAGTYRVWVNTVDVYNNKKKYVKWTGKNR